MTTATAPSLTQIETDELTSLFEAGNLPDGAFTHRDHVRVGWKLLLRYPLGLALHRMTEGVQVLARQRGMPDLFHATITNLYMLAIADCLSRSPAPDVFDDFATEHPALLGNSREFLLGYYSTETLDSPRARTSFLLPERLPSPELHDIRSSS